MAAKATWTAEQHRILTEMYHNHTCAEIAPLVGHTPRAVEARAFKLGLRKDKEWMLMKSAATSFKKGYVPPNKGKTWDEYLTKEQQELARASCFKKGRASHNQVPVGYERKDRDGYWLVKVAQPNVFKHKHRVLWEQHHGPIPKGMVISFIDGNKDNLTIENLRAETKKEKFFRCGCIHSILPPELARMVQLKGALKRQINKLENKNGHKGRNIPTRKDER